MNPVVAVEEVSKRYHRADALSEVTFSVRENTIYGLLGRNGAGKTTLMQILTGQNFATSGAVRVLGAEPYENESVLTQLCFVKESQRYPETFAVRHVLAAGALLFPHWDEGFAESLVDEFGLPRKRRVKKLSRGMLSALGVIVGLASRAPITLFDEPYLGLDAVARQLFYDRLLADYAEHPRTVILSTHLIDEVSDLIEHVLLLDQGRLVVDEDVEAMRGQVMTVTGPGNAVDALAVGREEIHRDRLGGTVRATLRGAFDAADRGRAAELGVDIEPASLQQLIVHLTTRTPAAPRTTAPPAPERELSR